PWSLSHHSLRHPPGQHRWHRLRGRFLSRRLETRSRRPRRPPWSGPRQSQLAPPHHRLPIPIPTRLLPRHRRFLRRFRPPSPPPTPLPVISSLKSPFSRRLLCYLCVEAFSLSALLCELCVLC